MVKQSIKKGKIDGRELEKRRIRGAKAGRRSTVIKMLKVIKCGEEKNGTRGKKEHNGETTNRGKDCKRDRKKLDRKWQLHKSQN